MEDPCGISKKYKNSQALHWVTPSLLLPRITIAFLAISIKMSMVNHPASLALASRWFCAHSEYWQKYIYLSLYISIYIYKFNKIRYNPSREARKSPLLKEQAQHIYQEWFWCSVSWLVEKDGLGGPTKIPSRPIFKHLEVEDHTETYSNSEKSVLVADFSCVLT